MCPELLHIGPVTIHAYGLMMALGFLAAGALASWGFRRRGLPTDTVYMALIAAVVGGLVGAKLNYVIIEPQFWPESLLNGRGFVWYGGLIGGTLGVVGVLLATRTPLGPAVDAIAPGLAVGYGLGRIGCLLNGCCYGHESNLPWAMTFPVGSPPTDAFVQPTQLYESLASFAIAAVLVLVLQRRVQRGGALFAWYMVLAGMERFLVEFLRNNEPVWVGLTLQQLVSLVLTMGGVVLLWRLRAAPAGSGAVPSR
jgi:phosphatidylglycerol:prolipoprotein diacylglycerol transferase